MTWTALTVAWTKTALKNLRGLETTTRGRIHTAVGNYAATGIGDVKPLQGSEESRLRVGDYRVIFTKEGQIMSIKRVPKRGDAY